MPHERTDLEPVTRSCGRQAQMVAVDRRCFGRIRRDLHFTVSVLVTADNSTPRAAGTTQSSNTGSSADLAVPDTSASPASVTPTPLPVTLTQGGAQVTVKSAGVVDAIQLNKSGYRPGSSYAKYTTEQLGAATGSS